MRQNKKVKPCHNRTLFTSSQRLKQRSVTCQTPRTTVPSPEHLTQEKAEPDIEHPAAEHRMKTIRAGETRMKTFPPRDPTAIT